MLFDRRHAKDVPLLSERFSASYILSYWPQSSPTLPKNQLLEKSDPFSFKTGAWYSSRKTVGICLFLCDSWSDLAKNFTRSLFLLPIPVRSFSTHVQFSRKYIRKCLQTHYNIGVKPVGSFSPTKIMNSLRNIITDSTTRKYIPGACKTKRFFENVRVVFNKPVQLKHLIKISWQM